MGPTCFELFCPAAICSWVQVDICRQKGQTAGCDPGCGRLCPVWKGAGGPFISDSHALVQVWWRVTFKVTFVQGMELSSRPL